MQCCPLETTSSSPVPPARQHLKPSKEEEMFMTPLQPSSMAKLNPKFSSRRFMSSCAARLTILDLDCSKATSHTISLDAHCTDWRSLLCHCFSYSYMNIFHIFLFIYFSSIFQVCAACRLQFHLLWRSQTNAVHAIDGIIETMWESQLALMPVRCLLSEEANYRLVAGCVCIWGYRS